MLALARAFFWSMVVIFLIAAASSIDRADPVKQKRGVCASCAQVEAYETCAAMGCTRCATCTSESDRCCCRHVDHCTCPPSTPRPDTRGSPWEK